MTTAHRLVPRHTVVVLVSLAAVASACGKKGSSSSGSAGKVSYTGAVGAGLHLALAEDATNLQSVLKGLQLASSTTADTLVPFFISNGDVAWPYQTHKPAKLNADGTFQFDIFPNEADHVILGLANSQAANLLDSVIGYVNFTDPTVASGMKKLPVPPQPTTVDTGTQTMQGKKVAGSKTISSISSTFQANAASLIEASKTDDLLNGLKNVYANTNPVSGTYYKISTSHYFNYSATAADVNQWLAPTTLAYTGLNFNFSTNDPNVSVAKLCTLKSDPTHLSLALVPPGAVSVVNNATNPPGTTQATSFDNDSFQASDINTAQGMCSNANFYTSKQQGTNTNVTFASGAQVNGTTMPAGYWALNLNGKATASFDVATTKPLTDDGHVVGYVPAFRITTDANNYVTKIEAKLYTWNAQTSAYQEVTDLSTFESIARYPSLGLISYSGKQGDGNRFQEGTSGSDNSNPIIKTFVVGNVITFTPAQPWVFQSWQKTAPAYSVDNLVFQYSVDGVQLFYSLVAPAAPQN